MDVKINNPEQIPEQIVRAAIAMMEQEEGRTCPRNLHPPHRKAR